MTDEIGIVEAYAFLRARGDQQVRGLLETLPRGGAEISCREGCSACCRQLVMVSPLEAFGIAAHVAADAVLAEGAREGHATYQTRLESLPAVAAGLTELERCQGYPSSQRGGELELHYFSAGIPCPFLADDRCSIHAARPFCCREHFAISPPELCALDLDRVVMPDTRLEFKMVALEVGRAAFALEDRLLPLPMAMEYALSRPEEARRKASRARVLAVAGVAERVVAGAIARLLG